MTIVSITPQQPARHYGPIYFNEVEAHWTRMVANAPDKLKQLRDCMIDGANCVRIAGYERARFRTVFARVAQDNELVAKLGGPEALQAKLTAVLAHYVDNYADADKKTDGSVTAIESKLLPKSTVDAIDFLLIQNDLDRLKKFLEGRPQAEIARILAYIEWKKS